MEIKGSVVVEGIAAGFIRFFNQDYEKRIQGYVKESLEREKEKFEKARQDAASDLNNLLKDREKLSESEGEILEAHQLLAEDMSLKETIVNYIEQGEAAPDGVLKAVSDFKAMFDDIDDEYLRERQKDIIDVGNRFLRKLLGMKEFSLEGDNIVLWAKDIEPSLMASLSEKQVKAVLLESGSKTSHAVIIAKAKGFVTMVGVSLSPEEISEGENVIVDANQGVIHFNPSEKEMEHCLALVKEQEEQKKFLEERAKLPARTKDGKSVTVAANISGAGDMEKAIALGCEGVGLFRTEFLFMDRDKLPTEEEQFLAYKGVTEQAAGNLCIIRTLDIGGDKPCKALSLTAEENPFLGFRAIRICLNQKEMFKTQLRAILRAGAYGKVGIMIPMVSSLWEILETKKLVEEVKGEMDAEKISYGKEVPLGIMVETPAASIMAPVFAKHVDFFSIGTNDLVQYTLAVDRGNQSVSYLYDYFNPAVLHSIHRIVTRAHEAGIWAGMCGEMAGDKLALPFLLALGIDELSMSPSQAPGVKEQIRNMDSGVCLDEILSLKDAGEVREYLRGLL